MQERIYKKKHLESSSPDTYVKFLREAWNKGFSKKDILNILFRTHIGKKALCCDA